MEGAWAAQDRDEPVTAQPARDGAYNWETVDTGVAEEEEAEPEVVLSITYGAAHGDRHFGGAPTANKSKWSISKDGAKTLMEAEISARMADIVAAAGADRTRRIAWILVADSDDAIGDAVGTTDITRFQIQLQANLATGDISYHGFPDEQALRSVARVPRWVAGTAGRGGFARRPGRSTRGATGTVGGVWLRAPASSARRGARGRSPPRRRR
ncbi:MAG: hypothetical protein Q8P41_19095 [Pseudomonadota bacterium]|nr:hypothetical protein [Pseudomonadota bacterium]